MEAVIVEASGNAGGGLFTRVTYGVIARLPMDKQVDVPRNESTIARDEPQKSEQVLIALVHFEKISVLTLTLSTVAREPFT
eukprot:SAG31_NODE_8212_length_1495_cov_4.561605_1_plen_81_part_00